ncbi:alanine/ornithine racemase family PLP-dependent enzyme [Ruminococcaceae bacterium OttesenSCG-928-D13]|nr:alanine/ornithine racemase family PLP-dependent enzyme [Ruminococcaceae bacterium OttesenSCG-928-D13]
MNPILEIDLDKFRNNVSNMAARLGEIGVSLAVVTKCYCADPVMLGVICETDTAILADSRLENIARYPAQSRPRLLLRALGPNAAPEVVAGCDISMNSEMVTIKALAEAAKANGKPHGVLLMVDMGDLREGIYYNRTEEIHATARYIHENPHLILSGLGVNLTCYGSIVPDEGTLSRFAAIVRGVEDTLDYKLPIVSGGNSSTIHMVDQGRTLPPEINNLRLGEVIICGYETANGSAVPVIGQQQDMAVLKAEVIEVMTKPSYPEGKMGVNAFGEVGTYEDKGERKKALLAVGRQDTDHTGLIPFDDGVEILGASSDHLIVDIEEANQPYKVGDVMTFHASYGALLRAFTSAYVKREYLGELPKNI